MAGTDPGALATLFVKSLESIENRKTHVLHLEKTLCFQTATFPPLQIFANLFLAELRKNNGLKGTNGLFSRGDAWILADRLTNSVKRATRDEPETT